MAIMGYMESSLAQSEIFKGLDASASIQQKAINLIKTAQHLTPEDIEASYIQVKQITDTLTAESVRAFESEKVILVYNEVKKLSLTEAVPFITYKNGITYVFVDKYVTATRDGMHAIQPSILRDILTAGTVSGALKIHYDVLAGNQYLQKLLMNLYEQFFTRILNRDYSIAADKHTYEIIRYYIKLFFLVAVYGASDTTENLDKLAKSHIKTLEELEVSDITRQYREADPTTLSSLLELLSTCSPRMKGLNSSKFINGWIDYYHAPALLAIDNIEYLIFMILTLLSGNNIVNVSASDIVKEQKGVQNLRSELLKVVQVE